MLVVSVLGSGSAGATEGEGLAHGAQARCSGEMLSVLFVLISVVVTESPIGLHNVIVKEHIHK